ncbi:MAG: hypothetical protein AB7Q17_17535 [Phycisphaerae bacterium]
MKRTAPSLVLSPADASPRVRASMRPASAIVVLVGGAGLAALTLLAHGWSLADGTVLDDWWHQKGLREHGWSLAELLRSLVIEPRDFVHLWWQDQVVRWEYARPLFILAMKFVYGVLGGNDPFALHVYSLLLHFTAACLVWRLAWQVCEHRGWALFSAAVFVVYPHATMTVAWSSSQNVVQFTVLALASLLAYLRASQVGLAMRGRVGAREESPPPLRRGVLAAALAFWLLALFTRENALLLPAFFAACEVVHGGWRHVWARRGVYLTFGLFAVGFVAWRMSVVTHGMPDVYLRRYAGEGVEYLVWCVAKLLHYVTASIWIAPMTIGPTGRFNPWTEAPGDCLLMLTFVAGIGLLYWRATRGVRGAWLWPLWILLVVLPVIPVIATPHSGYPSAVGLAMGLGVAGVATARRPARHIARTVAIAYAVAACGFVVLNRWQWTGIIAAERYARDWVLASPPEETVRDVYLMNLPFVNVYLKPSLDAFAPERFAHMRLHVLAYAPGAVLVEHACTVEQLDGHRFALTTEGPPFFSGLLGRFLTDGFRNAGALRAGDAVPSEGFEAQVVEADARGVRRLVFAFDRPLADSMVAFYVATPACGAARLRFLSVDAWAQRASGHGGAAPLASESDAYDAWECLLGGDSAAGDRLIATATRADAPLAGFAETLFRSVAEPVAQAQAAGVQRLAAVPRWSPAEWTAASAWWPTVRGGDVAHILNGRRDFAYLVKLREEVPHALVWAAKFIRSDLYLTGPAFPASREELRGRSAR